MTQRIAAKPLAGPHHIAYRCRDAEETRRFYEDILGLRLAAALVFDEVTGSGEKRNFMHLFFDIGNGNFLAFFDDPDGADPAWFARKHSFDMHIAFEAKSEEDLLAMQARIKSMGKSCLGPVDHHFVKSVYMYDPNGIQVEITWRTPDHDRIMAEEAESAREQIKDWSERTRAKKAKKFAAAPRDAAE